MAPSIQTTSEKSSGTNLVDNFNGMKIVQERHRLREDDNDVAQKMNLGFDVNFSFYAHPALV